MADLTGAGKIAELGIVLINKVSSAIGYFTDPKRIQKIAKANAEAKIIETLAECDSKVENARADAIAKEIEARSSAEINAFRKKFDIVDGELAEIAIKRMVCEEVKKQLNMENILAQAIPLLKETAKPNDIHEDWLMKFSNESRNYSDAEIQKLWAKVLAEEANFPGTFSNKTLSVIGEITKKDALFFEEIASICVLFGKVASLFGELIPTILENENWDPVYRLVDLGILQYSRGCFAKKFSTNIIKVDYFGNSYYMKLKDDNVLSLGQYRLTYVGEELYKVCNKSKKEDIETLLLKL